MKFITLLVVVLLVAQGLWGVTLYGMYWWLQPVVAKLIRLRVWIIVGMVLANLSLVAPHFLMPSRQWHWLTGVLLFAFYGFLLTALLVGFRLVALKWLPMVQVHRLMRWSVPIVVVVLLSLGIVGAYLPKPVYYQVQFNKPLKQPLRIALFSDTHFGHVIGDWHIRRLADIIEQEQPDILLLAGDIMDDRPDVYQQENMAEALRQIQAPLGQYAVLGNHDNYRMVQSVIVEETEKGGFTVMRDEIRTIADSFILVGRRDKEEVRLTPEELIPESELPIIVLDHQPADMDAVAQTDADLMLVGHTHAGQVFPGTVLVKLFQTYTHGHYQHNGVQLIVTSGFGLWGVPLRIGTRAEVAIIDLVP